MSQMLPDLAAPTTGISGWTLATAAFGIAVVALLFCYWQTVLSLLSVWDHDGTYQYAFLIPPLSLWVAFDLRGKVRMSPPVPSAWGLLAAVLLVFVWYAGNLLDVNLPQHFAVVALIPALVLACWGWRALWVLAFPLAYLVVFAVPWGDGLVGPLQDITAHFAVHALGLTGTPALLNGREITTPAATWMVADACSGVKFFIACGALGCLYAYLMYQRWRKRVVFVVLAAIVPIIANGLRVYFTILIGDTWGLHYATGLDHLIFGWQFFGTVLVLLLLAGWFFRDPVAARASGAASGSRPTAARMMVWPMLIVLLIVGPVWAARVSLPTPVGELQVTAPTLAGWSGPQAAADGWRPSFSGSAGQLMAAYRADAGDDVVELFHAVYTGKPRRGHTLITFENQLYDSTQAHILSSATRPIVLADGRALTAGELRLSGATDSRLVWFWYCVDQRCTRSPTVTKLLQAWDVLRGDAPHSSVWALSSSVGRGGVNRAQANLRAFAQALPVQIVADPRAPSDQATSENKP